MRAWRNPEEGVVQRDSQGAAQVPSTMRVQPPIALVVLPNGHSIAAAIGLALGLGVPKQNGQGMFVCPNIRLVIIMPAWFDT